jgi:hypothetical protein
MQTQRQRGAEDVVTSFLRRVPLSRIHDTDSHTAAGGCFDGMAAGFSVKDIWILDMT